MRLILLIVVTMCILSVALLPTRQAISIMESENQANHAGSSLPWMTKRTDAASYSLKRRFPNMNVTSKTKGRNPYFGN